MLIDVELNKTRFIELIMSIERDFDKKKLIDKLVNSDFFVAPASTKYHLCVEGGLCQHSLDVYENLKRLAACTGYSNSDSIKIVGLLHDISKMNTYRLGYRNVKVYSESGNKEDALGKFSWVSERVYEYIDDADRFTYGSHEDNSEFMVGCFLPLTLEESVAIKHHHGAFTKDGETQKRTLNCVFDKYPLAVLLHSADMISTYIDEAKSK